MPSSVRLTCSSSADRRRLSQSLNRVSMLGRLSGIDASALPPLRTDSPMTVMQDQLRSLYGAPSTESLNSVDAVVTQMSRPGEDDAALTGPESGRHSIRPARSESARSQHSAGTTNSRSRARKETLSRQQQQQSSAASVCSRPPLSHPEILAPGGHARARSEAAIRMGSTARKRQSMAMKGGQSRQSLAVTAPDLPDWLAQTFTGSRFASEPAPAAVPALPPVPSIPADRRESMACDSRRSSTAAVMPETPRAAKTITQIVREARRRSTVSKSLCGDDDDLKSVYSTRSAATTSYAPRNFSRPMMEKPQQIVREQGVNFEMITPTSSAKQSPRSFKALSIVIPPSQSSSSSFSVRSVTRSTTPPMVSATPSPARTVSSSSAGSSASSRGRTRTSTMSSATTVSRSPSPARGFYNPANDKSILTSVERSSDSYKCSQPAVQQSRSSEPRRVMPPVNPRYSIAPPTVNASNDASFATRASAAKSSRRRPEFQTRSLPCPHPNPLGLHPVNIASSRREQKTQDLRKPIARETFVHQPSRCETPPLFVHTLERSDSLFLGSSASRVADQQFFPEWSQPQRQPASTKFEPYRKTEDDLAGPVDDRRMLPSQKRSVSPAASLQRVAMTNAQVARGPGNTAMAAPRLGSTRSLRKSTAIDFASLRGENN
ncbi:hypothetical protein LQW54_008461 [Pestalotiopsis sp. IQ-011]